MDPRLSWEAVEAMVAQRRRDADVLRRTRTARSPSGNLTIRFAGADDGVELERLAQLDSTSVPTGPSLVAEVDGEVVAALALDGERPISDPFRRTAETVRLLELRASQLRREPRAAKRRPLRSRPRPRAAER
jgi:hypothetical protein